MRWYVAPVGAAAAIAVAVACDSGRGGSKEIISLADAGDAGVDAGTDAGVDAGPPDAGDGGIDSGTDGGPDAGPWHAGAAVWIGYREAGWGVTRIKTDGTVLHYRALGDQKNSAVWDIQVQPATATSKRRILVAFRRGAVGVYDGD